jgi:peptidoglycan hydrolase CwlO-like protein
MNQFLSSLKESVESHLKELEAKLLELEQAAKAQLEKDAEVLKAQKAHLMASLSHLEEVLKLKAAPAAEAAAPAAPAEAAAPAAAAPAAPDTSNPPAAQ